MNLIISYIDSAKAISITVATPCQHIRRIIPIDRAVKIRQAFDEAISEAESLPKIINQ